MIKLDLPDILPHLFSSESLVSLVESDLTSLARLQSLGAREISIPLGCLRSPAHVDHLPCALYVRTLAYNTRSKMPHLISSNNKSPLIIRPCLNSQPSKTDILSLTFVISCSFAKIYKMKQVWWKKSKPPLFGINIRCKSKDISTRDNYYILLVVLLTIYHLRILDH